MAGAPWLGGIDIDDFGGDLMAVAKSFGADAVSPVHGYPQNEKITDENYVPYVTKDMVEDAHKSGMKVIPWTINDIPTMNKLIDDGVDGIITDYPDRLREVMEERGFKLSKGYKAPKKFTKMQVAYALLLLKTNSYTQVEEITGISKSTLIRAKREVTKGLF